jgi:hypothetical protein
MKNRGKRRVARRNEGTNDRINAHLQDHAAVKENDQMGLK